jgi:hypothetical protein
MGAYPHGAAFGVVFVPTVVVSAIHMFMLANHNIVTLANDDLGRRRNSADKQRTDRRTQNDLFHFSLLVSPWQKKRRRGEIVSYQ